MANSVNLTIPNATVSASAGTGKTWLLVSRMIKLLINDVAPESILAITFTRKAAAEMYSRLSQRLFLLASCDTQQLKIELQLLEINPDSALIERARRLYEKLLHRTQSLKTTTFHAFCSDLLKRFPLEADIPPAFELVEYTRDLVTSAWDLLLNETTQFPDSELAQALELLFDKCNGIYNTRLALESFLDHRSDWWAYTDNENNAITFASNNLKSKLDIDCLDNPLNDFFNPSIITSIIEFSSLLAKHPTNTNLKHFESLETCQTNLKNGNIEDAFENLCSTLLTKENTPLKRKESKSQLSKMGEDGQFRFLTLHEELCTKTLSLKSQLLKILTYEMNTAWYTAGTRFLYQYQTLKTEQRLLDFADLEWKAYKLLNSSENAQWVQYKLDNRIDHLLIDEFQDTNPTQWHLIKPLLSEFAASLDQQNRSVLLVGDKKQSIYRFRRAEPELFNQAQKLLSEQLGAATLPLETSWRSSPAIIDFVNHLFNSEKLLKIIPDYPEHKTHHQDLFGSVEALPLVEVDAETTAPASNVIESDLRNPLRTPRSIDEDKRHYIEAEMVANKILQLLSQSILVGNPAQQKQLDYGDILILIRHRTHINAFEQALRNANIPYIGAERGTLLESQEVKDLIALLQVLITPFNNLSLATVLRSPLFACSDEDLMLLAAQSTGSWRERLSAIVREHPENAHFKRADTLLTQWSKQIDNIPVHDLLDKIYFDGEVINRYEAAYPEHLVSRVKSNLTRFLELALELDSGRYPSLGRFLARFSAVESGESDAIDEINSANVESKIRILTIHAAKGLEASVVFLADAANNSRVHQTYKALIGWPSDQQAPTDFILTAKKQHQDSYSRNLIEQNIPAEVREDINLLYVAVTRAKQFLFLSGTAPRRGDDHGWYGLIAQHYESQFDNNDKLTQPVILATSGKIKTAAKPVQTHTKALSSVVTFDHKLTQKLNYNPSDDEINPSESAGFDEEVMTDSSIKITDETQFYSAGQIRGQVIHRTLQLLCENTSEKHIFTHIQSEYNIDLQQQEHLSWWNEICEVFNHESTSTIFDSRYYTQDYNEIPIYYQCNSQMVFGIVDRIVITDQDVKIIDYKTHANTANIYQQTLVRQYQSQMQYYAEGARKIWPDKHVSALLLFTRNINLVEIEL